MKPLLILGLDGLDPYFVEDRLDQLDNFRALADQDNTGILESVLPPITAPAWMCSFTGKKPEKLGRFDFQTVDFEDYNFYPPDETRYWFQEFWHFMDGKAAIADVPGAIVHEIDGCMVGGVFDVSDNDAYPEEVADRLESDIGEFRIEGLENAPESERREKAFEFFERRKSTLDWLLDKVDADVYFTVFRLPDTMMHHGNSDQDMLKAYKTCDRYLGELMDRDINIIAISDHGAVEANRRFSVNTWLKKKGYLEQKGEDSRDTLAKKVQKVAIKTGELAGRLGFRDLLVRANRMYGEIMGEEFVKKELDLESVDWEKTEAFSYMTGVCRYAGIWINDERFSKGTVNDREVKRGEIKNELESHDLVEEVVLKEEVFEADVKTFPDLVLVMKEKVKNDSDIKPNVVGKISSYMHRKQGFIAVHGEDFDLDDEKRDLFDLAPTVLHYFGDDIPDSMDGKVMDIFSSGSKPGKTDPDYSESEVIDLDV